MQVKNKLIALLLLAYSSSQAAYYCPTCVNTDGGGSQQGYSQFQTMLNTNTQEIKKVIEDTIKEMDTINQLQGTKIVNTAQMLNKYELMTHELQKQQYDAERTLRYKCLNMDYEINILNSKITNVEMLLIKFKAAQWFSLTALSAVCFLYSREISLTPLLFLQALRWSP